MYSKLKADKIPRRERKAEYKFERTEEWHSMKKDLDRGLRPGEALQVTLNEEDKANYQITNRRTVARFVQKYITDNNLNYEVKSFHRGDLDYIIVIHSTPH